MPIEEFDQLGKIGERTGQAIDLVDDDDVDLAGADIVQQTPDGLSACSGRIYAS